MVEGVWIKSNRKRMLVKEVMSVLASCLMKREVNFVESLLAGKHISVFLNHQLHRGVVRRINIVDCYEGFLLNTSYDSASVRPLLKGSVVVLSTLQKF